MRDLARYHYKLVVQSIGRVAMYFGIGIRTRELQLVEFSIVLDLPWVV